MRLFAFCSVHSMRKKLPLLGPVLGKPLRSLDNVSVAAPEKVTPLQNFFQKNFSSLPGLFPKTPSNVPIIVNFFSKKHSLSTGAIAKSPRKGHTPFRNFSKKGVTRYTSDYRIFFAFCFWGLEKVENLPEREYSPSPVS